MTRSETFYILGNGPSLTPRIIQALPHGAWLGMNSAFRFWSRIGKYPRYYACLDPVVLRSQFDGIRDLLTRPEITDFFLHDAAAEIDVSLAEHPKVTLLSAFLERNDLRLPISRLGYQKQTTGALATRFVIEKGHNDLLLIGIDCKYVEQIDGAKAVNGLELVISKRITSNPNYFFGDYQAAGDRYQVPNPTVHSGNLHLQSFVALRNDLDAQGLNIQIHVGSDRSLLSRFGIFPTRPIWNELRIRRIGAVAVPLTPREWERQLQNLRLWMDSRFRPSMDAGPRDTCLHLFVSGPPDEALRANIETGLSEVAGLAAFFTMCRITFLDIPPEIDHYIRSVEGTDDPCTKSGPNISFLSTMVQCKEYEYVLHIETDCLPIRAGWLDAAEREIERAGTQAWIIGPAYFGPSTLDSSYRGHINGNAIYQTGDPDFQAFLQGAFLEILELLLRSGMRSMAYDTAVSVARYNIDALPETLRTQLSLALPRFAFSNFIRNMGGARETKDPDMLNLRSILEECDQTFMLHGRAGFHHLDGDRTYMPETYRRVLGVPNESLPFFHVWTNDPSWHVDFQGYGRVELRASEGTVREDLLLTFHFIRLRKEFSGRRWCMSIAAEPEMPVFQRATFGFVDDVGQVTQATANCRRVVGDDGVEWLRFESPEGPSARGDVVRLYLHGLSKRPALFSLRGIAMVEGDIMSESPVLTLASSPPSEACVETIDRWRRLYASLPRLSVPIEQPLLEHWNSPVFALTNVALLADCVTLTTAAARLPDAGASQTPLFVGVLTGAPWQQAQSMRVSLKVSDPAMSGEAVIRICRYAHSPWEFMDFFIQVNAGYGESNVLPAVFSHPHRAYRIELLRLPQVQGPVSLQLDLHIDLPLASTGGVNAAALTPGPPRLLIVDPTIMGTTTATGQIKSLFFSKWSDGALLQVCEIRRGDSPLGIAHFESGKPRWESRSPEEVRRLCVAFAPDVVYVRPIDNLAFMREIVPLVESLSRPVAIHVMDDWMERARINRPTDYPELMGLFMRLVRLAPLRLSICQEMSRMLAIRYGGHWTHLANGVDPSALPPTTVPPGPFVVRYMGGLAEDMSLSTVMLVSEAINSLPERLNVRLEIYTMPWYRDLAVETFAEHPATSVHDLVEPAEYMSKLSSSGALLIAYNFDEASKRYTRYSFSNKLPECLASGRPVLLIGPEDAATVREMKGQSALFIVSEPTLDAVADAIMSLAADPDFASQLGARGRALAELKFRADDVKLKAFDLLTELVRKASPLSGTDAPESASFKQANELMRRRKFEQALPIYASLMAQQSLNVYRENGIICIRRLGLDLGSWDQAVEAARCFAPLTARDNRVAMSREDRA